ncbi:DUF6565 domain-containing protein [Rufibacter immobilis]|uniref:DUF6565 domain-containing protein n=1 Tax=Rufibacter immobilis TaxID=1348778 RepID=UPI0035EF0EF2
MKKTNLFKKHTLIYAASLFLVSAQFACSRTENAEGNQTAQGTAQTSDQAYEDYKNYVSQLETDVEQGWDSTATDWDQRMETARADYDARYSAVNQYAGDFDENRRKEYDELQSRYNTAWATREEQYNTWRMNHQGAGMATTGTSSVDMSALDESKIPSYTATDIRKAYENFVAHVQKHKSGFSNEDWRTVEKYWNQLDDRKNAIQSQLSDKDKWEIAKAKTQYITMKNASKVGNTASKVGSDAKEVGKDVSNSKVGEAAKDAGKAVGNTAKKAGQKVGDAFDGKE